MENIPADYWLILCIIDYWLAPFTQNHISILTLQSVSTGGLAPGISLEKKIANVDTLNVRVSMPSRAYTSFLRLSRTLRQLKLTTSVNALSGLYLISTVPLQKPRFYAVSRACFCRYLSEYSDSSCFSCMLTFWTYLMRCTYPWHWIKYSTNYNRCHPIFSLSW